MRAKINLDLHTSAHDAAVASLSTTDPLSVTESAIAAFKADGNDTRDYAQWLGYFNTHRTYMIQANPKLTAPTASVQIDAQGAAAKAAKDDAAAAAAKTTPVPKAAAPAPGN